MTHERRPAALIERAKEEARRRVRDDQVGAPEEVAAILKAIENGLFDPDFDLSDVRRAFSPTPETLRAFRGHVGSAFKSYVTRRLLETAKQLVDMPEVDLDDIVTGLGFREAELFAKWFKRWTGKTPEQRCPGRPRPRAREPRAERPLIGLWLRSRAWALRGRDAAALVQDIRARRAGGHKA